MTSFDEWLARRPARSWAELAETEPIPLVRKRKGAEKPKPKTLARMLRSGWRMIVVTK